MATFKATIFKDRQREDKTWNVFIRFTHERKVRYIATTMYVTKKDMTASYKIKNQQIIDKCDALIRTYREKIAPLNLNLELNDMPIDDIVRKWCSSHPELKDIKNYISAINSFCLFFEREHILCSEVTVKTMKAFEEFLSEKKRAQSLYTSKIVRLFNEHTWSCGLGKKRSIFVSRKEIKICKALHSTTHKWNCWT